MADYGIKTMEGIWDDILRLHWEYLDTEENMDKLKMRRKLEGKMKKLTYPYNKPWYATPFVPALDELKDFLSIVQHDRKFFLMETSQVFKQSVLSLDQFSAYKALIGFEAISQYANNLFRKPWRKEYRSIKVSVHIQVICEVEGFLAFWRSWTRIIVCFFSFTVDTTSMKWKQI